MTPEASAQIREHLPEDLARWVEQEEARLDSPLPPDHWIHKSGPIKPGTYRYAHAQEDDQ